MTSTKSDSDATSLAPSSPPRSPKRQVYYVQSPSRDSHDGDKSSSMQPSPMESPSHPSFGRHSRNSSASRFSGIFRSSSGRKSSRKRNEKGWNEKGWPECNAIMEEGDYNDLDDKPFSRRCQALIALLAFVFLFTVFCLILWGASKPYKAQIVVKSLTIHTLYIGNGADASGVPTKMFSLNGTLNMSIYNPAATFGIHVSSSPINLILSEQIAVATGQLRKHYQPRKSRRLVTAVVQGVKVPLYGAGQALVDTKPSYTVPLSLEFQIKSRGYVVGKLVRTTHRRFITCQVLANTTSLAPIKFKKKDCTYK